MALRSSPAASNWSRWTIPCCNAARRATPKSTGVVPCAELFSSTDQTRPGAPCVMPGQWRTQPPTQPLYAPIGTPALRSCRSAPLASHVWQRRQRPLDLVAVLLERRRQRQALAQRTGILVDRDPRPHGGELEQHSRGLAEVDGLEVEPVDDRRRARAGPGHACPPFLVVLHPRGERHVVDRARAGDAMR